MCTYALASTILANDGSWFLVPGSWFVATNLINLEECRESGQAILRAPNSGVHHPTGFSEMFDPSYVIG